MARRRTSKTLSLRAAAEQLRPFDLVQTAESGKGSAPQQDEPADAVQARPGDAGKARSRRRGRNLSRPRVPDTGIYLPPVVALEQRNTARLLPARYSESVLTRVAASDDDLQTIFALDAATNERLLAEGNERPGVIPRELLFDLPYARIINAAFAHPHPLGARFSTPFRGAWYAAFELATAKAEVLFHRSVQFAEIGWQQPESLDYDHYQADFLGQFHDLRPVPEGLQARMSRAACLTPGSYVASQNLGVELLVAGSLGVVYPSARRPEGTCLACFRPAAVTNVRKRDLHRLTWYPDRNAVFTRVPREPVRSEPATPGTAESLPHPSAK